MKFANIDGQRRAAEPSLSGECPVCGATTIARCGEKNIWHWAHKGKRNCDRWWEHETDWHRDWKNHFPVEWQEVVCWADDGEKHVADVKTAQNWVIEFQHSYISPDERRLREAFYGRMVWIVDGLRRKNDLKQFTETLRDHGHQVSQGPLIHGIFPSFSRLVDDWLSSRSPVFLDFGKDTELHELWLLIPSNSDSKAYVSLVGKEDFIFCYRKDGFNFQRIVEKIRSFEDNRQSEREAHYNRLRMPQRPSRLSRKPFRL